MPRSTVAIGTPWRSHPRASFSSAAVKTLATHAWLRKARLTALTKDRSASIVGVLSYGQNRSRTRMRSAIRLQTSSLTSSPTCLRMSSVVLPSRRANEGGSIGIDPVLRSALRQIHRNSRNAPSESNRRASSVSRPAANQPAGDFNRSRGVLTIHRLLPACGPSSYVRTRRSVRSDMRRGQSGPGCCRRWSGRQSARASAGRAPKR
jgi:hypothetical protein